MSIGKRIIVLREKKGWNQRDLANKIGINASVMNRIESENRPIKDEELLKLSNVLECTSDYLLGKSNIQTLMPFDKNEEEFQSFANSPDLQKWYKELPKSKEEDLRLLREMWETIKRNKH